MFQTPTKTPTKMVASPVFAKPSDLFKKRTKRKITLSPRKSPFKTPTKSPLKSAVKRFKLTLEEDISEKNFSPLKCLQSTSSSSNDVKSFSFGSPKHKKFVSFSPIFKKLKGSPLRNTIQFPVVSNNSKRQQKLNNFSRVLDFSEDANFFTEKFSPTKQSTIPSPVKNNRTSCPPTVPNIDWSLKTKIRISTNRVLPFNGTFKTVDETIGLNNFVRGSKDAQNMGGKGSFASELYRSTLVWQFPYLPWMKSFPRSHFDKTKLVQLNLNSSMISQLFQSYSSSLSSLFKSLKSKHCPFFYVCTKQFTILFRASGVAGEPEPHALITPTTSGLRKALNDEQIDFVLPFHNRKTPPKLTFSSALNSQDSFSESGIGSSNCDESNLTDEDEEERVDEEENEKWLSSLGLSQDSFISSDSTSIRKRLSTNPFQTPTFKHASDGIDDISAEGRVKSIAFVRGTGNVQGLLNFLINERKLLVTNNGPFAGIPPTLLSPTPFNGGTCSSLEVSFKACPKGSSQSLSTVDVCGPILPNNVFALSELYGDYSLSHSETGLNYVYATLKSEESTCSFALEAGIDNGDRQWTPMFSVPNFDDSGLSKNLLQAICSEERQLHEPLSDIEISSNRIRYNKSLRS